MLIKLEWYGEKTMTIR